MKQTSDRTELVRLLSRITLLTQLGLSVVTPPILAVLLALWLQERFGLGDWVLLCGILLGILAGVTSVFGFVRREAAREARRDAGGRDAAASDRKNTDETGKENHRL